MLTVLPASIENKCEHTVSNIMSPFSDFFSFQLFNSVFEALYISNTDHFQTDSNSQIVQNDNLLSVYFNGFDVRVKWLKFHLKCDFVSYYAHKTFRIMHVNTFNLHIVVY